jgi:hypothetical protein
VLAYLEALVSALRARDSLGIGELLRHPLASALPALVVQEAQRIAAEQGNPTLAPINAMRLYHQTAHLLGSCSDPAMRRRPAPFPAVNAPTAAEPRARQIELELPYHAAVA